MYSGYITAYEYYVSAAPNGEDCPANTACNNLSYYVADSSFYFTDDAIFFFVEGTHTLQGILNISNVSNITLQGLGHIEHGFHETVMQSTSVIKCSDTNSTGIRFISSSDVVLKSLTIANCGFYWHQYYSVILFIIDSNNVILERVSVQNGSGDGLFLLNAYDVLIANSTFANNGDLEVFVANVYIIYNDPVNSLSSITILKSNFTLGRGYGIFLMCGNDNEADVIIENSMFSHNIAWSGGGVDIVFHGRGRFEISNFTVYNNTARYGGGGVDIYSNGNGSIEFSNCNIYNNTANVFGGGVRMFLLGSGSVEFINCTIYDNTAQSDGGGMYIDSYSESGSIDLSNCSIYSNNAYVASGLALRSYRSTSTSCFHFTNVSFHFNKVLNSSDVQQKGYPSAITLFNVNNITFDQIKVSNHNTTGLVGVNSVMTFDGRNIFTNNSGIYGGGIALYELSQLLLNQNANVSFVNNHASKSGGGIFVLDVDHTADCSFKVIPDHYPDDTKTVLFFVNNTADISGDVLYGGKIDDCTSTLYFDHLFHYPQQKGLSVVSSDPIQVCFCDSNRPNCSITNISISASPGFDVNVSLATVGLKDGLTQGVIKLDSSDNSSIVQYNINRLNANCMQIDNNRLNATCTDVTLTLRRDTSLDTTQVYITLQNSIEPLYDPYAKVIDVTIESCPIGFSLVNGICVCRSELTEDSIICDDKTQIITRPAGDMWIGYENDSNCLIVYHNCPYDYCNDNEINFTLNTSEKQCLYNRYGLLCGECSKNFSLMLGSNQCGQCTDNYIALIILFGLAGIALVAFVITLNLTVSVGTINGLIFYANVVKIYKHNFFPKGPIPFLSWFISWVNLDLGINTCFYRDMDSCSKTWLQFVFPAYIWFLLIIIIILLRYSSKIVQLVGRQIIPVLATMILLSYTKLIRTVFQALYYVKIPCNGDMRRLTLLRWYFDANVHYLQGCHLSLFMFSLVVLVLLIAPYTFYLLTIPLFEGPLSKYMCCCQKLIQYMKPFFDAYGGPYKDKCRFWTGFLLLVRVVLALTVSPVTVSLDVLTSLLIIIVFMYLILKGIYRHFALICLEEFFVLNLIFMAYMNAETSNDNDNSKGQWSSFVSVLLSFIVFCGIILYHVWDRLVFYNVWDYVFKSHWQQQITKVKNILKKPSPSSISKDMELPLMHPKSPDGIKRSISMSVVSVEMKRESILFAQDD